MTAHSTLGASGAHRWWNCPGSIRESAKYEDVSSDFAREGTAAHHIASLCLEQERDADFYAGMGVVVVDGAEPRLVHDVERPDCFKVDDDMVENVQVYLDWCRSFPPRDAETGIEQRLHLQSIDDRCFGTADFTAYAPGPRHLIVADFKYGRGTPVEVEDNEQLLYYAFGVATRYHNRGLDKVTIAVIQPRCPHPDGPIRTWEIDAIDLLDWSADLRDAVARTDDQDAPLHAGPWCRTGFCPAAPGCPELYKRTLEAAAADFADTGGLIMSDPNTFTGEHLAERLRNVDMIEDWCRRLREYAHHEAESGRTPPGYKLVAKRATRKFKDPEEIESFLRRSIKMLDEHLYADPKLRTPAQMETQLKKHYGMKAKEAKETIDGFVESVSSGTVLAPIDDGRPPVKPEAAEEFLA